MIRLDDLLSNNLRGISHDCVTVMDHYRIELLRLEGHSNSIQTPTIHIFPAKFEHFFFLFFFLSLDQFVREICDSSTALARWPYKMCPNHGSCIITFFSKSNKYKFIIQRWLGTIIILKTKKKKTRIFLLFLFSHLRGYTGTLVHNTEKKRKKTFPFPLVLTVCQVR